MYFADCLAYQLPYYLQPFDFFCLYWKYYFISTPLLLPIFSVL